MTMDGKTANYTCSASNVAGTSFDSYISVVAGICHFTDDTKKTPGTVTSFGTKFRGGSNSAPWLTNALFTFCCKFLRLVYL